MYLNNLDIRNLHEVKRLKLLNGITGIKSANLIGTHSSKHGSNVSIFSSFVRLGSDPALIGFVLRPSLTIPRNTYENIIETGYYTVNHIHESFITQAHYTSAKFQYGISEFEKCGLKEEYKNDFPAPYVAESRFKIGVKFQEELIIKSNQTKLIVGEVQEIMFPEDCLDDKGLIRLDKLFDIGIGDLNSYYRLQRIKTLPYARVDELPKF